MSDGARIPPPAAPSRVSLARALGPAARAPAVLGGGVASARGGGRSRRARVLRPAEHRERRAPPRSTSGVELADDLALVDDEDPVRERQDLLELERDEQDRRGPRRARSTRRRWTNSIAPTSRPRVGCAAISTARVAGDLARERRPSAGCRPRAPPARVCGPPPRTSNSLISRRRRARPCGVGNSQPQLRDYGRLRVVVQRDVLGDRELEHEAAALAVLGDVADARRRAVARALAPVTSCAVDLDRARAVGAQAGDRVDQLGLAVAVDACDADDLAGPDLEGDAAHLLDAAVVVDARGRSTCEQRLRRLRRRLVDRAGAPRGRPSAARGSPRSRPCGRRASRSSSRAGAR